MSAGPQIELTGGGVLVAVGLMVGGVLAWQAYKKASGIADEISKAASNAAFVAWDGFKSGAAAVGGAIDPRADTNLAYRGVNAVGGYATDDPNWTLGGAIYDLWNPAPEPAAPAAPYKSGGGGIFNGNGASGSW